MSPAVSQDSYHFFCDQVLPEIFAFLELAMHPSPRGLWHAVLVPVCLPWLTPLILHDSQEAPTTRPWPLRQSFQRAEIPGSFYLLFVCVPREPSIT